MENGTDLLTTSTTAVSADLLRIQGQSCSSIRNQPRPVDLTATRATQELM